MWSYNCSDIPDSWTDADMFRWETNGSERDEIMYIPKHNAKVRVVEDTFLCSFKKKDNTYKNIYICPKRNNLFYMLIGIPHISPLLSLENDSWASDIIKKAPLLGKIYNSLQNSEYCHLTDDVTVIKEGILIKVHNKVEDFIFPKNKIIDNPECVKKFALLSSLYNEISKEYDIAYDMVQRVMEKKLQFLEEKQKEFEEKRNKLLKKTALKVGFKVGLLAITGGVIIDLDIFDTLDTLDAIDALDLSNISIPDFDCTDLDYGFDFSDCDLADSDLGYDCSANYTDILDNYEPEGLPTEQGSNIAFQGKSSYPEIDRMYDPSIESAYNQQERDILKCKEGKFSSIEEAQRVLKSDQNNIDWWENNKVDAIRTHEINELKVSKYDAILNYHSEGYKK